MNKSQTKQIPNLGPRENTLNMYDETFEVAKRQRPNKYLKGKIKRRITLEIRAIRNL